MVITDPVPTYHNGMLFYNHGGATVTGRLYNKEEAEARAYGAEIHCPPDTPPKPSPLFKKKCCPKCKGMKFTNYKRNRRCPECGGKGTVEVEVD